MVLLSLWIWKRLFTIRQTEGVYHWENWRITNFYQGTATADSVVVQRRLVAGLRTVNSNPERDMNRLQRRKKLFISLGFFPSSWVHMPILLGHQPSHITYCTSKGGSTQK